MILEYRKMRLAQKAWRASKDNKILRVEMDLREIKCDKLTNELYEISKKKGLVEVENGKD